VKAKALKNKVLVTDLERGMRIINGILIPDDNGKSEGVRPRWARVYSVGQGVDDIQEGQWILIEHGRWTRMFNVGLPGQDKLELWGVDWPDAVLMVSDHMPETSIFSKWT
jgi:co-chaperonin GroES (HSP10)